MLFDNINNCGERVGYGALLHGLPSQVAIAPFEMNGVFVDPRNGNANKAHGIPSSSGSGPATPVIATATVAGDRANAPSAIATATSRQTAPLRCRRAADTPSDLVLLALV